MEESASSSSSSSLRRGKEMAPESVLTPVLRMLDKLSLDIPPSSSSSSSSSFSSSSSSSSRQRKGVALLRVQEDLEALQRMLRRIQAVLADAERREIGDEAVKLWLSELKDVAYDADDVLDDYEYELLRPNVEVLGDVVDDDGAARTPSERKRWADPSSVKLDVSFWGKIGGKIEEIRCRFEEISKQRDVLSLKEEDGKRQFHRTTAGSRPLTSHLVDASVIYGRVDDIQKVTNQLLSSGDCLLVLPIVGMGGIGKTTLAQLVYNDEQVRSHFQVMGWVCVSDDLVDVPMLHRRIIECLDDNECNLTELSVIQEKLKKIVMGKRFLLVLDDLWSEDPWESLRLPLQFGAEGSVVVSTTRNEQVAARMQTTPFHRLQHLSSDECWSIFRQHAFQGLDEPYGNLEDLEAVGKAIVRKCKGLPLAAKVLGGLLQGERDLERWEDVLQSDIWNIDDSHIIIPALRLSYIHLPNHLRHCFVYAAAFPKDYRFEREELVWLWMAQGFLQSGTGEAEDIGLRYFDDLVKRSFFQCDAENSIYFVMHDLIHDLALYIAAGECFQAEKGKLANLPPKVRHLTLFYAHHEDILECLSSPATKAIRTLLVQGVYDLRVELLGEIFSHVQFLRTLCLRNSRIDELPDSIGNLKHLRYLNLENIDIEVLPESICELYHLQALILKNCYPLESLPEGMGNLSSLRCLKVSTKRADFIRMPRGIGRLTGLRKLDVLNVGRGSEDCGLQELGRLNHLRGSLDIVNLQNVLNAEDAVVADLKSKLKIKSLGLRWEGHSGSCSSTAASPAVQTKVLECLQPPKYLETLKMDGYEGLAFPSWRREDILAFRSLTEIYITNCTNSTSLPPLGLLPSLKFLSIHGAIAVEALDGEFRGRGAVPAFPKLERLELDGMKKCRAWTGVQMGDFPCLHQLRLSYCPVLESVFPLYNLPALEQLKIDNCSNLASLELLGRSHHPAGSSELPVAAVLQPPLRSINIEHCPRLYFGKEDEQFFPPTLRDLRIGSECLALFECCRIYGLSGAPEAKLTIDGRVIQTVHHMDAETSSSVAALDEAAAARLFPPDCEKILKRALLPINYSLVSEPYHSHFNSILIDDGRKSFFLDRSTGKRCFLVSVEFPQPYRWLEESPRISRFWKVVVIYDVSWLQVDGKIEVRDLSPQTLYAAYIVFRLKEKSHGLDGVQKAIVTVGSCTSHRLVCLQPSPDSAAEHNLDAIPRRRDDGWMELELGEFLLGEVEDDRGMVNFRLRDYFLRNRIPYYKKGGLIVEGVEVRPKIDAIPITVSEEN